MSRILGIDTGGTFTDGVLYDGTTEKILKAAKTPTTQEDLMVCITNIVKALELSREDRIEMVSLSTTLVTNACVEDKGIHSQLVLIGTNPETVKKYGHEYGMPSYEDIVFIDAKVNREGGIDEAPDWSDFREQLSQLSEDIEAYAVVQMWGMVNNALELKAKEIITKVTEKQVICGHELSSKLNFMKRAVTCLLNSRITPLFRVFLDAVDEAFCQMGIEAPMVIVRSDAGVMSSDYAREKPVETLLSGPAASVWGALSLTGAEEGIVVDIGGTTSDIAILKNRTVEISETGAEIGTFRTATPSVNLKAIGIGGDSDVQVDSHDRLTVGPRKVTPICTLASRYPKIKERLSELCLEKLTGDQCIGNFYRIRRLKEAEHYKGVLTNYEKRILEVLGDDPKDIAAICEATGLSRFEFSMNGLVGSGLVEKSGLTPTDIMHVQGDFCKWDASASELALKQFATQYGYDTGSLAEAIIEEAGYQIYKYVVASMMEHQKLAIPMDDQLLRYAYKHPSGDFQIKIESELPVIGIGAPAHVLLPQVAERLNTAFICPDYGDTANAVGAAMGEISVHVKIKVEPAEGINCGRCKICTGCGIGSKGFRVTGMNLRRDFIEQDEAEAYAIELALRLAREEAIRRGAQTYDLTYEKKEFKIKGMFQEEDVDHHILLHTEYNAYAKSSIHHYKTTDTTEKEIVQ